ncbi:potassium transporter Kup [Legionella oakridgensis]|uniref:Probable potassium transport system protein Kup n=2 Tax=Legionella oakridgensis TaxID=29423 RepID=W0BDN5_9GAMM|nr:KUP/HAK/KT family potassium transporter [Legionella oakridgensis]AHE67980.1 K+ transporter [Legionella oakridgensis ATCC 33761 = DSM 21215]ETO92482.1 K+ transporter [Legionella oakridgensis RV-2-2007]KTD44610.1 KUP system potassium uptake protein [Legionella oakridgensis]STY20978.1 KUP system potassium uptake protein [Legionella longbeachae]
MTDKTTLDNPTLFSLSLAALGVVYGDIGTSPLYAMRESLDGLPINLADVLGVLSLIFWSLILVISFKYLVILFRADNNGEGGILALLALLKRFIGDKTQIFFILGIFGAGLMLGDGMLTPAISVISAIEGFHVIVPELSHWVLPLTSIILIGLFSVQSYGTAKIGFVFGPIIFIWFVILAILGAVQIIHNPVVLKAINPIYAYDFFKINGWKGYALLGGIFLVVTGGEALYADLGHFGKKPIRISWFLVALPGLLLNYFGQGAYLLNHPEAIANPFYLLAPKWFLFPLLIIATLATIIASQAVISATFSLTKQAVLLGLYPHLPIVQTSKSKKGQIYIPQMNLVLAIGTLLLIVTFKNSNALAHAYGIAVNLVMILTSVLIVYLAIKKWRWNPVILIALFSFSGAIDVAFLGANIQKIITGGWVPIIFALACAFIMYTWHQGRQYLYKAYYMKKEELSKILKQFDYKSLNRLPETTAIFITDIYDKSGGSFLHFLKLNRALPEHILIINYIVEDTPYVASPDRFEVSCLKENICELTLHYGFMDTVSIPQALYIANDRQILPFQVNIETATYMIEIPNVVASKKQHTLWFYWQEKLFAFLVRNYSANLNIEFYQLPYNRTIALGTYYMI